MIFWLGKAQFAGRSARFWTPPPSAISHLLAHCHHHPHHVCPVSSRAREECAALISLMNAPQIGGDGFPFSKVKKGRVGGIICRGCLPWSIKERWGGVQRRDAFLPFFPPPTSNKRCTLPGRGNFEDSPVPFQGHCSKSPSCHLKKY